MKGDHGLPLGTCIGSDTLHERGKWSGKAVKCLTSGLLNLLPMHCRKCGSHSGGSESLLPKQTLPE